MAVSRQQAAVVQRSSPLRPVRARTAHAKDQRRATLVAAAGRLFADADFEAITIARVAEIAGMAKGTAYLYFVTKEALFLELVRAELTAWLAEFAQAVAPLRPASAAVELPKLLARSFAQRPAVRRLLVLQHTVLEPKLNEDVALDFKLHMRDLMDETVALITPKIPGWRAENAQVFVMQAIAMVISTSLLCEPAPVIARVIAADARLKPFQIAFEPFLAQALATLIRGSLPKSNK